jgi:hypothetical protein
MDVFCSNFYFTGTGVEQNRNACFINQEGSFTKMESSRSLLQDTKGSGGSSWGDYDNDGDLDLYIVTFRGTNHLYQNNGSGDFDQLTIDPAEAIDLGFMGSSWGDFDNDGDLDLFVTSDLNDGSIADFANFNMLFENNGDGSFIEVATGNLKTDGGHSCSILDHDNDGDLDILVPNGSLGSPLINYLYSNNGNENKWININCRGRISNSSAIGTRIWIKANINGQYVTQMRELAQQTGLHSISSPRFHLGLGDAEIADSIIIRWPLGQLDTFLNVPANQFYSAIEDSILKIDFSATNYIQYMPGIPAVKLYKSDTSVTIDLLEHFRLVAGDTVPEIFGDTLFFELQTNESDEIVSALLEDNILTLRPGSLEGSTMIQVIASADFTKRMDQISVSSMVNIPNKAFLQALIAKGVDTNGNNIIGFAEAESVTSLNISNRGISDLTGIEAFVNLDTLNCNGEWLDKVLPKLRSLDISNNAALKYLDCGENLLTSLDVSNNTALTELNCAGNQLTSLDVSNNTALIKLDIKNMPNLHEVCVWITPFPPAFVDVDTTGSHNVYFTTKCSTGIENKSQPGLSIYPNPANDIIAIQINTQETHIVEISSLNGQLIYSMKMDGPTHQIDLSSFQKGLYFITVKSRDHVITEKIIKL